jgi:hypothetical protein
MKHRTHLALLAALCTLHMTPAWAADRPSANPSTKPSTKPSSTKAAPAKKPEPAKAVPVALPALNPEQLDIAQRVYTGRLPCELAASVNVTADPKNAGYFFLEAKGRKYHMAPVISRVGAVRLEEIKAGGGLWLQLGNKSMLMNAGSRVADDCVSPEQQALAESLKTNPAPNLLEPAAPAAPPAPTAPNALPDATPSGPISATRTI